LESKKNEKTFGATQAPNPGALGGAGQEGNKKQNAKGFCQFWGQNLFLLRFCFLCVA